MKQAFLKLTGKKFITAVFVSASILLTSFQSNATVSNGNIEIISGEKTNIHFSGSTSEALMFKVNINNEKGDEFTVTIKNSAGDVLFSKSFRDVNFNKSFKLLKGDNNNERYYFTITSTNKNLEDTYVVTTSVRTVEDVAVNKL
ncbi:MAG TPA: hypothetical protein VFW07_22520 [Parafilimonas sp.]|nr:hypothetical protein [Parafilimonas sp.]